jgi:hypothetical protein
MLTGLPLHTQEWLWEVVEVFLYKPNSQPPWLNNLSLGSRSLGTMWCLLEHFVWFSILVVFFMAGFYVGDLHHQVVMLGRGVVGIVLLLMEHPFWFHFPLGSGSLEYWCRGCLWFSVQCGWGWIWWVDKPPPVVLEVVDYYFQVFMVGPLGSSTVPWNHVGA